jgi:aspartyl protease family protein
LNAGRTLARLLAAGLAGGCVMASAQSVALSGTMGQRALLVIDGQPKMLAVGERFANVRLLSIQGDQARIERDGTAATLRVGAAPVNLGGGARELSTEVIIPVGPGGHFLSEGRINGRLVRFMVDTGATLIALSEVEADRIGLPWREGRRVLMQTANGTTPSHLITLNSVRLGDVELANLQAAVLPASMPYILLGNNVLGRFQMRRDSDVMRLQLR